MSSILLHFFIDTFLCQAYETKAKMLLAANTTNHSPLKNFCVYLTCARLYAHISAEYAAILARLEANDCLKTYLPEIWFYLIKVKATYYRGLAHYHASMGLTVTDVRQLCDNEEAEALFETLHDRKKFGLYFMKRPERRAPCMGRVSEEEEAVYGKTGMLSGSRLDLARAHLREAVACQEEALRQHGFCRKFSTHDYLHKLLEFYHERFVLRLVVLDKARLFS
jgi:hypothetical protein